MNVKKSCFFLQKNIGFILIIYVCREHCTASPFVWCGAGWKNFFHWWRWLLCGVCASVPVPLSLLSCFPFFAVSRNREALHSFIFLWKKEKTGRGRSVVINGENGRIPIIISGTFPPYLGENGDLIISPRACSRRASLKNDIYNVCISICK